MQEGGQLGCKEEGARSGSTQPLQRSTPCVLCCHATLPWIRSPRAAGLGANSWVSATQHGAKCGVQFVARRGEGGRGDGSRMRREHDEWTADAVLPLLSSPSGQCVGRGSMPVSAAHPRGEVERDPWSESPRALIPPHVLSTWCRWQHGQLKNDVGRARQPVVSTMFGHLDGVEVGRRRRAEISNIGKK